MNPATRIVKVFLMNDRARCAALISLARYLGPGDAHALHNCVRKYILDRIGGGGLDPELSAELARAAIVTMDWDQATDWVWDHVKEGP